MDASRLSDKQFSNAFDEIEIDLSSNASNSASKVKEKGKDDESTYGGI